MKVFACLTNGAIWFSSIEKHPMWFQIIPRRLSAWEGKMEGVESYERIIEIFRHLPHVEFEVAREEEILPIIKKNFLELWL